MQNFQKLLDHMVFLFLFYVTVINLCSEEYKLGARELLA